MQSKESLTGFVLHRRPYRETSMLLDFFTLEYGRVSAVAKGVRGSAKSDRKSLLQPFQLLEFVLSGRSNLKNLGHLEAAKQPIPLKQNALYCGLYINEVLVRALPETEPVEGLFNQYSDTLHDLSNVTSQALPNLESTLRNFEFVLLQEMGYLPDFTCDAESSDPIDPSKYYFLDPQLGFCATHENMKNAILGKYLLGLANQSDFSEAKDHKELMRVAKQICRLSLIQIIGNKPIKAREFFVN